MSKSASFLGGVVIGAVVGAVTGILFAPATGEDTRKKIGDTARDLKGRGEDLLEGAKDNTEAMIAKTLDAIDSGFEKLGKMVDPKGGKESV